MRACKFAKPGACQPKQWCWGHAAHRGVTQDAGFHPTNIVLADMQTRVGHFELHKQHCFVSCQATLITCASAAPQLRKSVTLTNDD